MTLVNLVDSKSNAQPTEPLRSLCPFVNMASCVRVLLSVAWMQPMNHKNTGWMLGCAFALVLVIQWDFIWYLCLRL